MRNLAVAASACCVCGLLTAGAATAAGAAAPTATGASTATSGLTIHQVLGGGHVSTYAGQTVSDVPGVVTDVTSSAFYLQDPNPVGGPFKQAIEVYTGSKPTVVAGDDVTVTGEVTEYYPDESDTPSSLSIAELEDVTVTVVSTGNALPAPVIIGRDGVLPPAQNIFGGGPTSLDVTTVPTFEPFTRALDFYQGLDSTYVEVEDPVAVGPTNDFAFAVVPDNGVGAGVRTAAGGLADIGPQTVNSRRLEVYAPGNIKPPTVNTGDHFSGPVEGIMTECEGNPELDLTASSATGISHGLAPQVAPAAKSGQLTVATYNLDNLSPTTSKSKYASLGTQIVHNLGSPDILAVQEIQDNDGATDDDVVAADVTMNDLVAAIAARSPCIAPMWA
jgi:uncharacterized protein